MVEGNIIASRHITAIGIIRVAAETLRSLEAEELRFLALGLRPSLDAVSSVGTLMGACVYESVHKQTS